MSKSYLITLRPIESFSFGGQKQFQFKNSDLSQSSQTSNHFNPYFISTNALPEQTALFGVLRYHLLQISGLIKPTFNYDSDERKKISTLIGEKSFSFFDTTQEFGKIKGISPLFIKKENQDIIVKNPFNNKETKDNKVFSPIILKEEPTESSQGLLHLPKEGEYSAKEGYGSGYYNISQGCLEKDIFIKEIQTGNAIKNGDGNDEDALFKREVYRLGKGYSFAFYAKLDGSRVSSEEKSFVTMGQKSSLYEITVREEENNLATQIKEAFSKETPKNIRWYYALSDCFVKAKLAKDFAIIEEKTIKHLRTNLSEENYFKGIKKQDKALMLYRQGSVFYNDINTDALDNIGNIVGYNQLVEIQGVK